MAEGNQVMHKQPTYQISTEGGEERLRELILYVAGKCQGDPKFGATKLNKILWWADFLAYAQDGQPITGMEYMRLGQGPVPRRLVPVRTEMEEAGEIVVTKSTALGGYVQHRVIPLREPNLNKFTPGQIALVDSVIEALWMKTAKGVSRLSHSKAWEVAADRGPIPYEAVFLSDDRVNRFDLARTRELGRQFGWATR